MHFPHGSEKTCLNPLVDQTSAIGGLSLIAHLCHDIRAPRGFTHDPRFMHRPGHRLFDKDVLAELHRRFRDHRMCVVGRGDENSVDVALLFEHPAEVRIPLRLAIRGLQPEPRFILLAISRAS